MTTEHRVIFFISVIRSWHNVKKSRMDPKKWVWLAMYIFHEIFFAT